MSDLNKRVEKLEALNLPPSDQEPARVITLTQDMHNPDLFTYHVGLANSDWRNVDYRQGLQDATGEEKMTEAAIYDLLKPRPDEVVLVIRYADKIQDEPQ